MVIGGSPVSDESENRPEDESADLMQDDPGEEVFGSGDSRISGNPSGSPTTRGSGDSR